MTVRTVLVGEETGFAPSFQKGLLRATERWSGAADSSRLLERTEYEYDAKHLMVVERTLAWPTTEGYNCSGDSDCDGARCMPLAPQNLCGVASCSTDADCASGAALCRGGACLKIDAVSEYGYDAERRRTLTGNHRRLTTTGTGSYEGGAKANFGIDGRLSETGDVPVEVNTKHSYDTRGYVTQVERKVGGEYKKVLTYGYDIDGNITSVSHWNWNDAVTPAQTTTYKYDDFGRLTRVSSPDGGTRVYRYDLSDRLVEVYKSGSPSNISIKYTYDFLGRVTSIAIPDRYQWAFVYDEADGGFTSIADCRSGAGSLPSARHGIGRLTGAYFTQAGETWTQISNYRYAYSPRGLMVIEAQKRYPSSCSNVQRMVYDSLYPDRLREIRYPTGRRVLYDYEQTGNGVHEKSLPDRVQVGYAAGLSNVATDIRYTAGGRLARFTHANGLRSENDWALDGSPLRRRVVSGDGANVYLFREVQAWTPDGAPKLLANRNKKHFEHFGYDEDFDRLTDAKVKNAGGALQAAVGHAYTDDTYTFTPNLLGNRETSTPWFGGSYSHAYAANSSRLTKVTPSMLVGDEDIYAYDPLGAITSRKSRTCTPPPFQTCTDNATFAASYDALERMRTAGGNTYSYDYRNLRTRKVSAVNSLPTDFYYDDGGNLLGEIGCASTSSCAYPRPMQEYVYLGSERISVIKSNQNADGSTSDVALYSLHNGLLGEPLRATNSSLEIVWKRDHDPYGAVDSGHYEVDELSNKLEANCYINTGDNGTVRSPGARTLAIKFDAFKTEGGFDRVRIKDTTDVVTFFDKSGNQYDDGLRCCAADAEVPFGSTCTGTCADGSACSGSTAPSSCNASGFFTTGFSIGSDVPIDGLNLTFGPDSCNSAASTSSCSGTLCATCICSGGTCPSSCCGGLCGQNVRLRGVSAVDFKATYSTTALTLNLRLPGQYENSETGLFYNWNRYYDPRLGTYWQMDPLLHRNSSSGPANPIQPYSYADASPIRWTDATGLLVELYCESIPQAYHLARHCYIRTKCDTCESFDVTVELWGPSKENPAYGRPKELPFNPSDPTHGGRKNVEKYPVNPSSSDDCQIEKCIRTQFQDSATKLPRYNPRGPNSNTFAADILSKCGVNGDFPWNAIGSGESGSCL